MNEISNRVHQTRSGMNWIEWLRTSCVSLKEFRSGKAWTLYSKCSTSDPIVSEFWNAIEPVPTPVYHSVLLLLYQSNPTLSILIIVILFQGERYFERTIFPINWKPTCKRRASLGCKKEVKEKIKPSEGKLLIIEIGCHVLYCSPSRRELDRCIFKVSTPSFFIYLLRLPLLLQV